MRECVGGGGVNILSILMFFAGRNNELKKNST